MNIPEQIGNYKLEREIGNGASSQVWLARHNHLPGYQVAVKVLMSQDREAIQRFTREAAIASRLRHPNIAQLYDYGYSQPFYYSVIEHVEGGSLRQLIEKQGRLQLDAALAIFRQIAAALDYAHSLSVVHRDVSPGNILFEQRSGRAVLTDFGIAREPGQAITVANAIMGTPGYLSPEHIQGSRAVTHLSDLFALGVVFYHMLSGALPWDDIPGIGENPGFSPPIPLKQRGVESMPGDVDRVLRTMLAIDPSRRFASARAAVDELDRIFSRHQMTTQIVLGVPAAASGGVEFRAGGVESNEVEAVLGPDLVRVPIERAHRRADELRNPVALSALLDAWAAQGRLGLRRKLLGRLARLHKVSSHNVYFYRLRLLYERRAAPEDLEEPDRTAQPFPIALEADRWLVELPPVGDFVDQPGERVVVPGSTRVVACKPCGGNGLTTCPRCKGKQRVLVARPLSPAAATAAAATAAAGSGAQPRPGAATAAEPPPPRSEQILVPCPECSGRGGLTCPRCEGHGRLVQRKAFRWTRRAEIIRGQDDRPALDEDWLHRTCKAEVVYAERQAAGLRPEWSLVPNLASLATQAQAQVDAETRIVLSELTVSFIPVTDIVFDLGKPGDGGLYKLTVYGFENYIPPDWRFFNWERVAAASLVAFFALVALILALFAFL